MNVVHILKNGSTIKDISGYVVKVEDASTVYRLIDRINRKGSEIRNVHNERRVYG